MNFDDIRAIREKLGLSQREMADLLAVSTRAVQSYEQGWRRVPAYVQKLAGLMLCLHSRPQAGPARPCWERNDCDHTRRERCRVYRIGAGDLCWLIGPGRAKGAKPGPWTEGIRQCAQCPAMTQWLEV